MSSACLLHVKSSLAVCCAMGKYDMRLSQCLPPLVRTCTCTYLRWTIEESGLEYAHIFVKICTVCPQKTLTFLFIFNNSFKNEPILIIFGTLYPEGT